MFVTPIAQYLFQWAISALALVITAMIVPGFIIRGFGGALMAAVMVGLVNILVRPVLLFLTFPINILTLGLFTFVVNAITLKIAAAVTPRFEITGWLSAIIASIVLTLVNLAFRWLFFSPEPMMLY
jgi:putative membrane protein